MAGSVVDSWDRIVRWMEQNTPDRSASLLPPATSDELQSSADALSVEFPEDFILLYKQANGLRLAMDNSFSCYPKPMGRRSFDRMSFSPMNLSHIVQEWEMMKELLDDGEFDDFEKSDNGEASDKGDTHRFVKNVWWNIRWIPFAENGGGDYFFIDLDPAEAGTSGQVVSHSHETGEHKLLAPSLGAYLADLADAMEKGQCTYEKFYGIQRKVPMNA